MTSENRDSLSGAMAERILLLDGAMGTEIQRRGLTEDDFRGSLAIDKEVKVAGNNDLLVLTRPDVITDIHRSYLEAGADVIETCTFNAQRISQADYKTEHLVADINREGARIAVEAAREFTRRNPSHPRFVAGSVGPTTRILSMATDPDNPEVRTFTFNQLEDAYFEQIQALLEGGVDALLIETIVDTLNAKAAISAAQRAMESTGITVPVMLSLTLSDASGRTLSGQTVEAFVNSVMHASPLSIGLNCSFGAEAMIPWLRQLAECCPVNVTVHPNAGLPDQLGRYNDTPEQMAGEMKQMVDAGLVNMIGGCCGTTPLHIAKMREMLDALQATPRRTPMASKSFGMAGLEPVDPAAQFVNVGERCNVAGSRKFLRLISEKKYDEALAIAAKQVADGAMALDVNMDDGLLDAPHEMATFLSLMGTDPSVCRVPIMIDSSRFEVIEEGLKCVQGKCIVNSISLKEGETKFLEHAKTIRRLGAAVVVMAFDEEGQATTYSRKIEICERAYRLLTESAGFDATDIIFDPNILTVATGMPEHFDYAYDYVRATRWIRDNLPGAHVSGGLSNLSFAFRGNNLLRESMHAVFLREAVENGMDMAIMNPSTSITYADVPADLRDTIEDVLFRKRDAESTERLLEIGKEMLAAKQTGSPEKENHQDLESASASCSDLLGMALIKGDSTHLADNLECALAEGMTPMQIISGPLMSAMNEVGRRFGRGEMFLPQVVKTARTMKQAVDILSPQILAANQGASAHSAGKVLIATVKGDVHDIGKNIVGVVLTCNGFDVTDLGVMVHPDTIVAEAKRLNPDFICLSGLITPSLDEMCRTVEALADAGITTPVMIGGATTSPAHTAIKIATIYPGLVVYASDASQNPLIAAELLDPARRDSYIAKLKTDQEQLRQRHAEKSAVKQSSQDPDTLRPQYPADSFRTLKAPHFGVKINTPIPLEVLIPKIDWRFFYHLWKVDADSEEGRSLYHDAMALLNEMAASPEYSMRSETAFFSAHSEGNNIVVVTPDGEQYVIPTPRQPYKEGREECLSLADYIAPDGDVVGMFAVTVSQAFVKRLEALKKGSDDYASLLMQSVGDRLAEAAAAYVNAEVANQCGANVIRPAVGYPSLPSQKTIFTIDRAMPLSDIGITLTENGAMYPQASVCGLLIAHPEAKYFDAR